MESVRRSDRQASTPGCSTRPLIVDSGPGGIRTLSIPGSKPRWSADCLPSRSGPGWSRTIVSWLWAKSRCRWTTGPRISIKWSYRESHPDLWLAEPASSCWTITPKRKRPTLRVGARLEPTSSISAAACRASRFLTNSDDLRCLHRSGSDQRCASVPDSNPQTAVRRHLFSRQGPHPARWLPLSSCGGWNRTNMKTFRASHPAVE
jgi:hypothetical protein